MTDTPEDNFIEGMAAAHDAVWGTLDRLQQSLNDVMGVYIDMKSVYDEQNPQARELEVAYRILSEFRERFTDNYDEVMREHKSAKAWREDTDQLKSEWPE